MSLVVKKPDRSDFVPAPAGLHRAVCVDVVDMGLTDTGKYGIHDMLRVVWQTEATGADGKRYVVHRRYTKTLGPRASLRKDLVSWRGMDFSPEELKGFDVEKLVGANCQLNIVHNQKEIDGDLITFANVNNVVPPDPDKERLAPLNYERENDREAQPQQQQQRQNEFPPPSPEAEETPDFDIEF